MQNLGRSINCFGVGFLEGVPTPSPELPCSWENRKGDSFIEYKLTLELNLIIVELFLVNCILLFIIF
jgi:hypothetical protein